MKHYCILIICTLGMCPVNIHAQFWDGVLMGIANAMQNYNYNQQFRTNAPSNRTTTKTKSEREKKLREEDDGFSWYQVCTWNGTDFVNYGAQDINGRPLISERYESVYYYDGYFHVEKNGKKGLYTKERKCICEAKYNEIHVWEKDDGTYIEFKDNVGIGIMNDKGRVIIPSSSLYKSIIYLSGGFEYENDAGNWIAFDMDIHGNKINKEEPTTQDEIKENNYILEFYEISDTFFKTPKTYNLTSYMVVPLGTYKSYTDENGSVIVGNNSFTCKFPDGTQQTSKIVSGKEMLTVITEKDDVVLPLYKLDNGTAIRAIQYKSSAEVSIHVYGYNNPSGKYYHLGVYSLSSK